MTYDNQHENQQNSNSSNTSHAHEHHNDKSPGFRVLCQYLKDLSFENPNPQLYLANNAIKPFLDVNLDVEAKEHKQDSRDNPIPENESLIEVTLAIQCSSKTGQEGNVIFHCELKYAGLFLLRNIPKEQIQPLVSIEAPHLLFPFARQILAKATTDGGFPPLLLDPVDFNGLYLHHLEQSKNSGANSNLPN